MSERTSKIFLTRCTHFLQGERLFFDIISYMYYSEHGMFFKKEEAHESNKLAS